MKNYKFELKRMLKSKVISVVILLSFFVAFCSFLYNYALQDRYYEHLSNRLAMISLDISENLREYYENKGKVPEDKRDIYHHRYESIFRLNDELNDLNNLIKTNEKRYEVPKKIIKLYNVLSQREKSQLPLIHSEPVLFKKGMIALNERLIKENLPYENPEISITGTNLAYITVYRFMGLPLMLIIMIMSINLFGEEREIGTQRLRFLQPQYKFTYFLSKVLVAMTMTIISIIVVILTSILLGKLFGTGLGSFKYPILLNEGAGALDPTSFIYENHPIAMMELSKLMLSEVYLFLTYALMIFSLVLLLSVVFKNRFSIIVGALIIIWITALINAELTTSISLYHEVKPFLLLGEKYNIIMPYLSNKELLFFAISIPISLLIMYSTYILQKFDILKRIIRESSINNVDITLQRWEKSKISRSPLFKLEVLKIHNKKEVYFIIVLLYIISIAYYQMNWKYSQELQKNTYYNAMNSLNSPAMNERRYARKIIDAIKSGDNTDIANVNLSLLKDNLKNMVGFHGFNVDTFNDSSSKLNIELMKKVIEQGNKSEILGSITPESTYFDEFKDLRYKLRYDNISKRGHPSTHMVGQYFYKRGGGLLLLFLISMILTQGFSGEKEKSALKMIYLQPGKRLSIYLSKFIVIAIVIVYVSINWISWIPIGAVMGDLTDSNYPTAYYYLDEKGSGYIKSELVNRWGKKIDYHKNSKYQVNVKFKPVINSNLSIYISIIIIGTFITSFSILNSILVKGRWTNAGLNLSILIIGFLFSNVLKTPIAGLLPFTWLNPIELSNGYINLHYYTNYHPKMGLLILLAWSMIIFIIGYNLFKRVKER